MKILKQLFISFFILMLTNSCYQDDSGDFIKIRKINLIADSNIKRLGETITFKVNSDFDSDITSECQITIDEVITNTPNITSNINNSFRVKATYKNLVSNEITVTFDENFESFVKRVLVEDYTGTWCGNCTRVSYAIDNLLQQTTKAVVVAIHRGPTSTNFDPYNFDGALPLENLLGIAGTYPAAKLNRTINWTYPQLNFLNQATNLTSGDAVRAGLAMSSTIIGSTINLEVKVGFFDDYSNLKLVVYALENDLIYEQENYTTYYGNVNPVQNFEHNHVLRAVFTNILGDVIPSSESSYGETYTRSFSVPIPSNFENASNMEFVSFIVGEDNKAINVRKAAVGENQEFED